MSKCYNFKKKIMYDLYINKQQSLNQITKKLNCHIQTVSNYLKKYKIARRTPLQGQLIRKSIIGKKFGYWKILSYNKKGYYNCECKCGILKSVRKDGLLNGQSKSCGCSITRKPEIEYKKDIAYHTYKNNSKNRNVFFDLSLLDFKAIIIQPCYYCGGKSKRKFNGIDKLNPKKGYEQKNIVPCCDICNYAKHILTVKEFKNWIKKVHNYFIKRRK